VNEMMKTAASDTLRNAAEQGDAKAQFSLGWCYSKGEGVAKDTKKAVA
jgi:TPR repeat protein